MAKQKEENGRNLEKLKVLADKIEEYRGQEDEIKNALISAQKLSDASVREARHKSEIIIKDAEMKAGHIVEDADRKITEQKREYERMQKTVSDFRARLLGIYREHLTMIDALPGFRPENAAPQQPAPSQPLQPSQTNPVKTEETGPVQSAPEPESDTQPDVSNFED